MDFPSELTQLDQKPPCSTEESCRFQCSIKTSNPMLTASTGPPSGFPAPWLKLCHGR